MAKGDPEGAAPDRQLLDVVHGGLLRRQHQHDVLARQEALQRPVRGRVRPGDVGNDLTISPEENIGSLQKIKIYSQGQ